MPTHVHTHIQKEGYCEELAYVITEADKSYDVLSATRRAGGVV